MKGVRATKYCGATSTTFTGNLGGYPGGKAKCEAACNSPSAHECNAEEIVRTTAAGGPVPAAGWMATGTFENIAGFGVNDCEAYTNNGAGTNGSYCTRATAAQTGSPSVAGCYKRNPLLSCD
jgi:hypothetical protein